MTAPITSTPGGPNTHHLKLSKGGAEVGLILAGPGGKADPRGWRLQRTNAALQIMNGGGAYEDEAAPWSIRAQDDFSGGMGGFDWSDDVIKVADAHRINLAKAGHVLLAGWDGYGYGDHKDIVQYWNRKIVPHLESREILSPGYSSNGAYDQYPYLACKFAPTQTVTAAHLWLWVRAVGSPFALQIRAYSNNAAPTPDQPNASLVSVNLSTSDIDIHSNSTNWNLVRLTFAYSSFSAGTIYWLRFYHDGSAADHWEILGHADADMYAADTATFLKSTDGTTWEGVLGDKTGAFFRITEARDDFKAFYFEYKGALYCAARYLDGGVSRLFMQGDQGVVKTGATTNSVTIASGTADWAAKESVGGILKIIAGTGADQEKPWSLITAQNSATAGGETTFTVSFDVAPDDDSEVVILGTQKWTEIDTNGATPNGAGWATGEQVSSILVINHAVYFAMGDSVVMSRMRRYNSAGTWTTEWNDEDSTDAKFTYLEWANDSSGNWIWGAKGGYPSQMRKASALDASGTGAVADLGWVGAGGADANINTGDVGMRVRSLARYTEFANLWVMKEDSIIQWIDERFWPVGLANMGISPDYRNGMASCVYQGGLIVSYKNTIMRWFEGYWDNIGPSREKQPVANDRTANCNGLFATEDFLISTWDAGASGYSYVLVYNGLGWSEFWRAPSTGMRCSSPYVQALPGDSADRLFFNCGDELISMPFESMQLTFPHSNNGYQYFDVGLAGYFDTAWFYFDQQDADKVWASLRVMADYIVNNYEGGTVVIEYRLDYGSYFDSDFTRIGDSNTLASIFPVDSTFATISKGIQFRVHMNQLYPWEKLDIRRLVVKALVQKDVNKIVELTFRVEDDDRTMRKGVMDSYTDADEKLSQLEAWAESPAGVLVTSQKTQIQGGYGSSSAYYKIDYPVVLEYLETNKLGKHGYLCSMTMYRLE